MDRLAGPVANRREFAPSSIDKKQIVALATELISEVTSKMARGDKAQQVA